MNRNSLLLSLILLVTFITFFPAIFGEITNWDDNWMVTDNQLVRSLDWSNLKRIFTEVYHLNYQPLVFFSFALEYAISGLNPMLMHLDNVLLHLVNVLLVYQFIRLLATEKTALITALLFAIHPMHVESVAWITERRDLLYGLFFLLSLIQYTKYVKQRIGSGVQKDLTKHFVLALLFMILSGMAKGMAVSLSLVIILIDLLLNRKLNRWTVLDKAPFMIISLVFGLLAVSATLTDSQIMANAYYSVWETVQLASMGLMFYLQKFLLPIGLSAFHPYPPFASGSLPGYFLVYTAAVVIMCGLIFYSLKFTRKVVFGFGFFLVTILFVLQFYPTHAGIVAEHYSYLPYIGLAYLFAEGGAFFIRKVHSPRVAGVLGVSGIILVSLLLSSMSFGRVAVWKDEIILWTDVIAKYPDNFFGYYNRGYGYSVRGNFDAVIIDLDKAIECNPYYYECYNVRGEAYHKKNNISRAMQDYEKAIEINPRLPNAYCNRGTARFDQGNIQGAIEDFNRTLRLDTVYFEALVNRANAMASLGNILEAESDIKRALALKPDAAQANLTYGNLLVTMKRFEESITYYSQLLVADQEHVNGYYNRGSAKYMLNDLRGACADWGEAARRGHTQAAGRLKANCGSLNP